MHKAVPLPTAMRFARAWSTKYYYATRAAASSAQRATALYKQQEMRFNLTYLLVMPVEIPTWALALYYTPILTRLFRAHFDFFTGKGDMINI